MIRNLPANAGDIKMRVQSGDWEDPLEKEMATHSSILAWRSPWTEEPDRLQSMGSQESDTTERLSTTHSDETIGLPRASPEILLVWKTATLKQHFGLWSNMSKCIKQCL